jgi:hypothetical protein
VIAEGIAHRFLYFAVLKKQLTDVGLKKNKSGDMLLKLSSMKSQNNLKTSNNPL